MCFQRALYSTIATLTTKYCDYLQPEVSLQTIHLMWAASRAASAHLSVTTTHFSIDPGSLRSYPMATGKFSECVCAFKPQGLCSCGLLCLHPSILRLIFSGKSSLTPISLTPTPPRSYPLMICSYCITSLYLQLQGNFMIICNIRM